MLEKTESVDKIEVVQNGCVQVRVKISITENGSFISGSYHRYVICPGDDYSKEDARVQAICAVAHTQDVVDAYKAAAGA